MTYCVIDNRQCGIGDLLVHLWCAYSARVSSAAAVKLNPRAHTELALTFGLRPEDLTSESVPVGPSASLGGPPGSGLEERLAHGRRRMSRFHAWCEHFGLPHLSPIRPPYHERSEWARWAETTWSRVEAEAGGGPRVMLFPITKGGPLRDWPWTSWVALAHGLDGAGFTVVADLPRREARNRAFPRTFQGYGLLQMVALMARADCVVAGDSGPAHLGATLGVPTVALCGPTQGEIVFGHALDSISVLTAEREAVPCVGCHFRADRGFAAACGAGCLALSALSPDTVFEHVSTRLEALLPHFHSARPAGMTDRRLPSRNANCP